MGKIVLLINTCTVGITQMSNIGNTHVMGVNTQVGNGQPKND